MQQLFACLFFLQVWICTSPWIWISIDNAKLIFRVDICVLCIRALFIWSRLQYFHNIMPTLWVHMQFVQKKIYVFGFIHKFWQFHKCFYSFFFLALMHSINVKKMNVYISLLKTNHYVKSLPIYSSSGFLQ